jgi:hypothetical protein
LLCENGLAPKPARQSTGKKSGKVRINTAKKTRNEEKIWVSATRERERERERAKTVPSLAKSGAIYNLSP